MSEKEFQLDDILDELKDELKQDDQLPLSEDRIEKELKEFKKYDTQALLDEILGHGNSDTQQENPADVETENPSPEPENTETLKPAPKKTPLKNFGEISLSSTLKAGLLRFGERNTTELPEPPSPQEASQPDSSEKAAQPQETPQSSILTDEELEEQVKYEKEQMRKMMQSTAHLKYLALQKSREKRVKDFVLKPNFTITQPVEIHQQTLEILAAEKPKEEPAIKEYVAGKTSVLDIPKQQDTPESKPYKHISTPSIQEWKKRMEQQVLEENEEPHDEYTSSEQTEEIFSVLREMKISLYVKETILGALFLLSLILIYLNKLTIPNPIQLLDIQKNPLFYCIADLVLLIGVFITCFDIVRDGIVGLIRRDPGRSALFSLSLLGSILFNAVILSSPDSVTSDSVCLYVPLTILTMVFAVLGKHCAMQRILTNFKLISGDGDKFAVSVLENQELAEDFTKGALHDYPVFAANKKTPFLSHFFDESFSEDLSDKISKFITPIVSGIALLMAVIAFFMGSDIFVCFTVLTGVLLMGACSTTFFMVNQPLSACSKSLSKLGGAVLGYHAVENFSDVNSVLLNASDLFLPQNITLYGIKTFSNMAIDRVILDATSVLCETNSIFGGVFLNIINNRKDFLEPVEGILYEDGMGISGWIQNRRVLIGSRELMINHNIPVPSKDYEDRYIAQDRNLIYLSTAGELSAVFVFGLECDEEIQHTLEDIYNNDILSVVKAVDPILTRTELSKVFGLPEDAFKVIPSRLHKEADDFSHSAEPENGAVSNNGTLSAYIYSLLLAKRLSHPIRWGALLHLVSIGVGVLLFIAFTLMNGLSQLDNLVLCIYQCICLTACIAVQKIRKL